MCLILLDKYVGVEMLGHRVGACCMLVGKQILSLFLV